MKIFIIYEKWDLGFLSKFSFGFYTTFVCFIAVAQWFI